MPRTRWTDERLDDRFCSLDRDIRDLRTEMREGFAEVRGGFGEVRREIDALRLLIYRMGGGFFVTIVVAVLLRGI